MPDLNDLLTDIVEQLKRIVEAIESKPIQVNIENNNDN